MAAVEEDESARAHERTSPPAHKFYRLLPTPPRGRKVHCGLSTHCFRTLCPQCLCFLPSAFSKCLDLMWSQPPSLCHPRPLLWAPEPWHTRPVIHLPGAGSPVSASPCFVAERGALIPTHACHASPSAWLLRAGVAGEPPWAWEGAERGGEAAAAEGAEGQGRT